MVGLEIQCNGSCFETIIFAIMKKTEITPEQYQEKGYLLNKHGKPASLQYIHRLLKNNYSLPNVIKVNKYSRFYTLVVND